MQNFVECPIRMFRFKNFIFVFTRTYELYIYKKNCMFIIQNFQKCIIKKYINLIFIFFA